MLTRAETSPGTDGFHYNDGGRAAAGFKGKAGDCVVRSVAIASGRPYLEIYKALSAGCKTQRRAKRIGGPHSSARDGVHTQRKWFKDYMAGLGFRWVPAMKIGSGCRIHLDARELPAGRLAIAVSGHYTAMVDGIIHDTYDPRRPAGTTFVFDDGTRETSSGRCVYGYWILEA